MFACIYIPDFPVQASLLTEQAEARSALNLSPLAILDGPANLPRVFAVNCAARKAGIQAGMTRLQAEVCIGVVLHKRSLASEDAAQSALLQCAARFSPRVESTEPGAAILDFRGTEKLWGGRGTQSFLGSKDPNSLWRRATQIMTAAATEAGLKVRIAIASNPDTAFIAARGFSENKIIPIGDEARHLASLPIDPLPLSPAMRDTLDSWGIRTVASLAALPAVAIVERLGQDGLYLQRLARGEIVRPLLVGEENAPFTLSFEFDDPVETLESIFFVLHRLFHDLCSRLISTAQAASELRLTVGLCVRQIYRNRDKKISSVEAPDKHFNKEQWEGEACEHAWKLPMPTQDKNLLFSLVRLHLEQATFSAPVRSLKVEAVPVKPRLAQGNLFAPPSPEPEQLEITLERIHGIIDATGDGAERIGSPSLLDTHKPGSFVVQRFSSILDAHSLALTKFSHLRSHPRDKLPGQKQQSSGPHAIPLPALRIFRPALETVVELAGKKPHFVRLWNRHRRVLAASGPWSSSGNWWNGSVWMRTDWDVVLQTPEGAGFYRIYRDRMRQRWFVEGVFD